MLLATGHVSLGASHSLFAALCVLPTFSMCVIAAFPVVEWTYHIHFCLGHSNCPSCVVVMATCQLYHGNHPKLCH